MRNAVDMSNSTRAEGSGFSGEDDEGEHLLLLTEHFYPTDATCGRLLTALSEDLVASGMQVSVLTSFSVHSSRQSRHNRETHSGIEIRRVPALRLPRARVLWRLINEISLTFMIVLAALARPKLERIMVTSSPPILAPAAAIVAAVRRVPLIYLVMDVYPDIAAATGHLRKESLAFRIWDRICRFAILRSSRVVVLGQCMRDVVRAKAGNERAAIDILPNWADGEEIFPLTQGSNRFFKSHPDLRGRFLVQYSGNLGLFHDFETILGAAEHLAHRDDVHFLIIGKGARKLWIEEQLAARGLENVTLLPYQPRSELNFSLNAQSASLVTLEPGTEGLCVPSKFYPVLAAGKPVLAVMDRDAEVARVVEREDIGVVVRQHDAVGLASAIERLSDSPQLCSLMGKRARMLQQRKYDRRHASKRYLKLIGSIATEQERLPAGQRKAA